MKVKILFCIPLFFPLFGLSQKNIQYYFQKSFANGFVTEMTVTDTVLEKDFLQYSYSDGDYKAIASQAKIFHPKKGKDLILVLENIGDMQCSWQNQFLFEIDYENDTLIKQKLDDFISIGKYETFVDKDYIESKIFNKYKDSIRDYLADDNHINQFMEELFDYEISLDSDKYLFIDLSFCDYIPTNIVGFTEKEIEYLKKSKTELYQFNKRKGVFEMRKKKLIKTKF